MWQEQNLNYKEKEDGEEEGEEVSDAGCNDVGGEIYLPVSVNKVVDGNGT